MPTFSKMAFSGSTDGRGVKVAATSIGSGTTIHTATSATTEGLYDVITVFAYNDDSVARLLTLGWGGTTDPDDLIIQSIPAQTGLTLVVADLLLQNSLVLKAAGESANVIVLHGYVNRIS